MKVPKYSNSWKRCPNVPKRIKKPPKQSKHYKDELAMIRVLQRICLSSTSGVSNEDLHIENSNMLEGQFEIVEDPNHGTNQDDSHSDKDLNCKPDNNGGNEND